MKEPGFPEPILMVTCTSDLCQRKFRAVRFVPTLSGPNRMGKLQCPFCGHSILKDPKYVWFGLSE